MKKQGRAAADFRFHAGDNDVPLRAYIKGMKAYTGLVKEVAKEVAAKRVGEEGPECSFLAMFEGLDYLLWTEDLSRDELRLVQSLIREGIEATEKEGVPPRGLGIKACRRLRDLSTVAKGLAKRGLEVQIWTGRKKNLVTRRTGEALAEHLKTGYRDFGSISGRMCAISVGRVPYVKIDDPSHGRYIRCEIGRGMIEQCRKLWLRPNHIEASGLIHYRDDGSIIKLKADKIRKIKRNRSSPSRVP